MKKLRRKIVLFVLCFGVRLAQTSNQSNSDRCDSLSYLSYPSELHCENPNVKISEKWMIQYSGHDMSGLVGCDDFPNFEGTEEELRLSIDESRHRQRREFVSRRNSLLKEISKLLDESNCNISSKEFVSVEISQWSEDNYKLNLNYNYYAYNQNQDSFEDEKSSRSQEVSSKEQIIDAVKTFVEKHTNKSLNSILPKKLIKGQLIVPQKRERDEKAPLFKKHVRELKQLSLDDFFKQKSIMQAAVKK